MPELNPTPFESAVRDLEKPAATPPTGDDRIRIRAYELYEKRKGQASGDAESDWYQAEAEIAAETASQADIPK